MNDEKKEKLKTDPSKSAFDYDEAEERAAKLSDSQVGENLLSGVRKSKTSKRSLVCTGDIAGTSIDVFEYCGMGHLTEEQKNEVLENVAEAQLFEESGAELVDVKGDGVSSSIDDWEYEIYSEDEHRLKIGLRFDICCHLGIDPSEHV